MATIKPIEGRSIHQIQSGQVIVDLNSVAKELVENALDAGATSIEVRFKNSGLDAIEVQDNGGGISPSDFETLALKHYTSKLSTYDDLTSLQTFGFRGEALSSLCALSQFHIVTSRAEDGPKGSKLEFEVSGKLKGTSVVAAKQGTTVIVENLFHALPVRRKELEKTVKREYGKVLQLLHAYACISVGVKFSVSNQVPKGKKAVAFATQANPNTKENIANVYGAKTLLALIPLDLKFQMESTTRPNPTQTARHQNTEEDSGARDVRIIGHISRPVVGEGRQTPDRQMFFVNSRPCELPQVKKAFNEVYKSYNMTQSAFIFADIKLDTNAYDVNVSPDKRSIMLHDQTALLEALKSALTDLFEAHDQSVPQAQLPDRRPSGFKPPVLQPNRSSPSIMQSTPLPRRSTSVAEADSADEDPSLSEPSSVLHPNVGFIKASLIERFAGRHAEERQTAQPATRPTTSAGQLHNLTLPEDLNDDSGTPLSDDTTTGRSPRKDGSPLFEPEEPQMTLTETSSSAAGNLSKAVQDFNARLASQQAKHTDHSQSPRALTLGSGVSEEESIPTMAQTPRRSLSQGTIQNAFDRMRPMRTPAQQATITIGDTTTTTTIGNAPRTAPHNRIHTPRFSLQGTPLGGKRKPAFSKSLRNFAAPGTQMDESDEAESDDGVLESSLSNRHALRSPSPAKRMVSKAAIETSTDQQADATSMPPSPLPVRSNDLLEHGLEAELIDNNEDSDDAYLDETEKKMREEAKIARMIAEAEEAAARPTEANVKRANKLLQSSRMKHRTNNLVKSQKTSLNCISSYIDALGASLQSTSPCISSKDTSNYTQLTTVNPEERLSLTVTKTDFHNMRVIGQFNLGFILTVRPPTPISPTPDLFIIDQHASDEKYNFERFSATTVLVSQRLVHPHPLELTAIEEEIILNNEPSLTANGFVVLVDTSGSAAVGKRAKLTSLPMSREVTFTPTDLEELLALLLDNPQSVSGSEYIPRPSKVRKLLASRACRSSIMIGKTLQRKQMKNVVRHMGEMDKPWSCPHGRPTMRHLYGLENWKGWNEDDGIVGVGDERAETDWAAWVTARRV